MAHRQESVSNTDSDTARSVDTHQTFAAISGSTFYVFTGDGKDGTAPAIEFAIDLRYGPQWEQAAAPWNTRGNA